jgi:hypothetical protein
MPEAPLPAQTPWLVLGASSAIARRLGIREAV